MDSPNIIQSGVDFVNKIKKIIVETPSFNANTIYNADQSGFQLEMHFGRSYAFKGNVYFDIVVLVYICTDVRTQIYTRR